MSDDNKLYGFHLVGPDEVHAAPSKAAAEDAVVWYSNRFKDATDVVRFDAIEWPHSAETHAAELPQWHKKMLPRPADHLGRTIWIGDVVVSKTLKVRMTITEIGFFTFTCAYFLGAVAFNGEFAHEDIEHANVVPREPVVSSNLASVGYDPVQQQLHVEFRNGKVWAYMGVPVEVNDALHAATSIGSYFSREVRPKFHSVELTLKAQAEATDA